MDLKAVCLALVVRAKTNGKRDDGENPLMLRLDDHQDPRLAIEQREAQALYPTPSFGLQAYQLYDFRASLTTKAESTSRRLQLLPSAQLQLHHPHLQFPTPRYPSHRTHLEPKASHLETKPQDNLQLLQPTLSHRCHRVQSLINHPSRLLRRINPLHHHRLQLTDLDRNAETRRRVIDAHSGLPSSIVTDGNRWPQARLPSAGEIAKENSKTFQSDPPPQRGPRRRRHPSCARWRNSRKERGRCGAVI